MFDLLFSQPVIFFVWVFAFLIALSVHEFCHAAVATALGDSTAKRLGRLTLNPAAHLDPMGFLAMILIGFGWGKPVPYNPYNLRWPKWGPVAIAVAGPGSNLALSVVSILLLSFLGPMFGSQNLLTIFLEISVQLNILLLTFNIIPLPPLDGSKVLLTLLAHPKYAAARAFIEARGPMILLFLVVADSIGGLGLFSALFHFVQGIVFRFVPVPSFL